MMFLAFNDQFFIAAKAIVQKMLNSVDFIMIIQTFLKNFYIFLAIIYNFGVIAR